MKVLDDRKFDVVCVQEMRRMGSGCTSFGDADKGISCISK